MEREKFYRDKAAECEARARETSDASARAQWLKMAQDWRSLLPASRGKPAGPSPGEPG